VLLENPFYQDFIQVFLLQDSSLKFEDIQMFLTTLERITSLSNDWSYISDMMNTIRDTLACFDLNRFVAVNNETELENLATKMFTNGTFLAGELLELIECCSFDTYRV
jgi:predicted ATP-grasp superfamily ATP-dependent carboligase